MNKKRAVALFFVNIKNEQLLFFFRKPFDAPRTRRGFSPGAYVRRVISNFDLVIRTAIKNKTRKIRFFAGRIVQAQKCRNLAFSPPHFLGKSRELMPPPSTS